jgi:hypothetical protein
MHCFPLLAPLFPEATQAMHEICSFIRTHIGEQIEIAEQAQAYERSAVL